MRTLTYLALALSPLLSAGAAFGQTVPMSQDALTKCANAGVAECQYELGKLMEEGKGVDKNLESAKWLYTLAYKSGYDPAGAALLRLTRSQPPSAVPQESSSLGDSTVATPAAAPTTLPAANAAVPIDARIATVAPPRRTSSPASWEIKAEEGSAPTVANISLGDSAADWFGEVESASCDEKVFLPGGKVCTATIDSGRVNVTAGFLHDELVLLIFDGAVEPNECKYLIDELTSILGRTGRRLPSRILTKMMMPAGSGKFWRESNWEVATGCQPQEAAPSDIFLMVVRDDIDKVVP